MLAIIISCLHHACYHVMTIIACLLRAIDSTPLLAMARHTTSRLAAVVLVSWQAQPQRAAPGVPVQVHAVCDRGVRACASLSMRMRMRMRIAEQGVRIAEQSMRMRWNRKEKKRTQPTSVGRSCVEHAFGTCTHHDIKDIVLAGINYCSLARHFKS